MRRPAITSLLVVVCVGAIGFSTPTAQAAPGTWTATGSMAIRRYGHTATLLTGGKVLVAGGFTSGSTTTASASAALYDSATGTWTATGTMATPRGHHTATLLPDGRVLVAGGASSGSPSTASAELYDPATGSWTATGTMATARLHHSATLLPDGMVIVAGGLTCNGCARTASASSTLYDPTTGTWAPTGSMTTPRGHHTATLLPNGRLLVAGGLSSDSDATASAELYDPATGAWAPTGTMVTGTWFHIAALLPDGRVLVAGGFAPGDQGLVLSEAQLYDPAAGTWTWTGSMATPRFGHTATLLPDGKVLVAGGASSDGIATASAELYDPGIGTWAATGSPWRPPGAYHTATLLTGGKVLVAGGFADGVQEGAELYEAVQSAPSSGTLVVVKDAVPDDSQDFSFTAGLHPSSFQLDDDGDPGNELSNAISFEVESGDGYSITEHPRPGWARTTTCDDGSPVTNIEVSAGETVTCTFENSQVALGSRAWAWGDNEDGQVGNGTTTDSRTPVPVSGLSDVVSLAGGAKHSLALKADGTVWAWGDNRYGQVGGANIVLTPKHVSQLSDVVRVAAGAYHSLAVKDDGSVWAWGFGRRGELGNESTTDSRTPVRVRGLSEVVSVAGGWSHSLAVTADGTVWAWGENLEGQLGAVTTTDIVPTPMHVSGLNDVVSVAAGGLHSLALKADGTVWAWGHNFARRLGVGTDTDPVPTPMQVSGLSNVVGVAGGSYHSLALKADGTVWVWGADGISDNETPVEVFELTDAVGVAGGFHHSVVLKADGTVWTWGLNSSGQLGDGSTLERWKPIPVAGLTGVSAVAAGRKHTIALGAEDMDPIGKSVTESVEAGETVTTDAEGDGATPHDPIETSLTSAVAGEVTITQGPSSSTSSGTGFSFAGQEVRITAPAATPGNPHVIAFRLDELYIPLGHSAQTLAVFRNGVQVSNCAGAPGVASPDPCVASRETLPDGDARITVRTSQASLWNLGFEADTLTPRPAKEQARDLLALLPTSEKRVADAMKELDKSLQDKLWVDDSHLDPKHGQKVFDHDKQAVQKLLGIEAPPPNVLDAIDALVAIDRRLAEVAISDAEGGKVKELQKATNELAKGDALLAKGKPAQAIDAYRSAWQHALKAIS